LEVGVRARLDATLTAVATSSTSVAPGLTLSTTDPLVGLSEEHREAVVALRDGHGVAVEAARVLVAQPSLRRLFDDAVAAGAPARPAANWVSNELQRELDAA